MKLITTPRAWVKAADSENYSGDMRPVKYPFYLFWTVSDWGMQFSKPNFLYREDLILMLRNDTGIDKHQESGDSHPTLMAQLVELQEENARLREDAERYRWLRDVELQDWIDLYHQNPANIDAAIDAARKEQK